MYKNIITEPMRQWADVQYPLQGLTPCPITSTYVRGNDQTRFLIPGGEVKWWHCSACQGWHVMIVDSREKS